METIAPKILTVKVEDNYGRFVIEPLERGFGTTIGNSLRRVLLSSIPGAAVTMVKIENVQHEFSTIPGVVEDATDIILNLKNLAIKLDVDEDEMEEPIILRVDRMGEGEVTAADIDCPPEVEILNPAEHIATLAEDGHLRMELTVDRGRGYVPADKQENRGSVIGEMAVASIFTPVPKVSYTVEPTRVGHKTDLDRLTMDIWTNGTIKPLDALSQAARIMDSYLRLFFHIGGEEEAFDEEDTGTPGRGPSKAVTTRIEDLDFSVRTSNCLRNQGIETLGDLLGKTEDELLATRHFGKKSLMEVKEKLAQCGLSLSSAADGAAVVAETAEAGEGASVVLPEVDIAEEEESEGSEEE